MKKLGLSIIDETLNSNKEASALAPDEESTAKIMKLFDDTKRFLDRHDDASRSKVQQKMPVFSQVVGTVASSKSILMQPPKQAQTQQTRVTKTKKVKQD